MFSIFEMGGPARLAAARRRRRGRPRPEPLERRIAMAASIAGTKFNDLNGNGLRDTNLVTGATPDVVFVIDVSGSTSGNFGGTAVGDVNGDNAFDRILDAEIAGFIRLNQLLIDQGFGATADVAIVRFSGGASRLDMDPSAAGPQSTTNPTADRDADGVLDVVQLLRSLRSGGGTNFQPALQEAQAILTEQATAAGDGNVIFLSDGQAGLNFDAEVAAIRAGGSSLRAFGVGPGASLDSLRAIDPNAVVFSSTDELLNVFSGIGGGGSVVFTEPALPGTTIFLDLNTNGALDPGEPTAVTQADDPATTAVDETGRFSFTGLAPGTYVVREVVPPGFVQTAPAGPGFAHTVVLAADQAVTGRDFGNMVAPPPAPMADVSVVVTGPATSTVGAPVTITFTVTNNGQSTATNVGLSAQLPGGATIVDSLGGVVGVGGTVAFNVGSLANGASATFTVVLTPTAAGRFETRATVGAAEADPLAANNSALTTFQVVADPGNLPDLVGPSVVALQRFGFHAQPTFFVLTFDEALDAVRATNLANYRLTTPNGRRAFAFNAATYDAATRTVALRLARPLRLRALYRLTVRGSDGGLIDAAGNAMDGDGDGLPGGDLAIRFDRSILSGRFDQRPGAALAASRRSLMRAAASR